MPTSNEELMSDGLTNTTVPIAEESSAPDSPVAPSVESLWTDEGCRDLWATVVLKALEDWEWALKWLGLDHSQSTLTEETLASRDQEANRLYWDCLEFFFHPDSGLSVMCDWLDLEKECVLSKVRKMLKDNPIPAGARRSMLRKPIWERPVSEALTVKWTAGRQKYGDLNPDEPFVGDPLLELYEELLDGINYSREVGTKTARSWGSELRTIAEEVREALKERDRT